MIDRALYQVLVPDAPRHRRTEADEPRPGEPGDVTAIRSVLPGLQAPRLVSSFNGSIDELLFCFPSWATADPGLVRGYKSIIGALRVGTRFVVVHHESVGPVVESWFAAAGHPRQHLTFVSLPEHIALTDWAEDAYVSVKDAADGTSYLVEPWVFGRVGDAMIADAVEEHTTMKASGSPLVFQGGNCLVGDEFWLLGRDYFEDTLQLITQPDGPVEIPEDVEPQAFAGSLFQTYLEAERDLIVVGTSTPLTSPAFVGTREGDDLYLDLPTEGTGRFQPIFHIDMFITLIGRNRDDAFEVLIGSPELGDELLGTSSPFALHDVYDALADDFAGAGFAVLRNPLVHWPTVGRTFTFGELQAMAEEPTAAELAIAVSDLAGLGALQTSPVRVRRWHHVTWNNCLVERSTSHGQHVYLPTFGHRDKDGLGIIDDAMTAFWVDHGFAVHALADFNDFAERQGVVHCIKKYLTRGD